jgi:hypothetical protein
LFEPGDAIPFAPGRGWLLMLDEQIRQVAKAVDLCAGRKVLLEDSFAGDQLAKDWTATVSKQPGTAIRVVSGELRIDGAANVAAYIERAIPAGARLVVCRIDQRTDGGASWGPGMTLVWPDGKVLRVNLRAEGRFGVDDGRRQILDGANLPNAWTQVAVRLEDTEVVIQASQDQQAWQELARFPSSEFPGDPVAVRLGKMSPGSKNEDFSTLGPAGVCAIKDFRVMHGLQIREDGNIDHGVGEYTLNLAADPAQLESDQCIGTRRGCGAERIPARPRTRGSQGPAP